MNPNVPPGGTPPPADPTAISNVGPPLIPFGDPANAGVVAVTTAELPPIAGLDGGAASSSLGASSIFAGNPRPIAGRDVSKETAWGTIQQRIRDAAQRHNHYEASLLPDGRFSLESYVASTAVTPAGYVPLRRLSAPEQLMKQDRGFARLIERHTGLWERIPAIYAQLMQAWAARARGHAEAVAAIEAEYAAGREPTAEQLAGLGMGPGDFEARVAQLDTQARAIAGALRTVEADVVSYAEQQRKQWLAPAERAKLAADAAYAAAEQRAEALRREADELLSSTWRPYDQASEALAWIISLPGAVVSGADLALHAYLRDQARGEVSEPPPPAPAAQIPTIGLHTPGMARDAETEAAAAVERGRAARPRAGVTYGPQLYAGRVLTEAEQAEQAEQAARPKTPPTITADTPGMSRE